MKRLTKERFEAILSSHRLWLKSNGKQGERAIIQDYDTAGCMFTGMNLKGFVFNCCHLACTDFSGSSFEDAEFNDCFIGDAVWINSNFPFAMFQCCTFMDGIVSYCDFGGAEFYGTELKHVNLTGSNFRKSKFFNDCKMQNCKLNDAIFSYSALKSISLECDDINISLDKEFTFKAMPYSKALVWRNFMPRNVKAAFNMAMSRRPKREDFSSIERLINYKK